MAKSLAAAGAKADAVAVKALAKPTVVPWAINQIYWRARSIWDRLIDAGSALRASQIAALAGESTLTGPPRATKPGGASRTGKAPGVPGTARADVAGEHRRAVADAVHQAVRAAADTGVQPAVDQLTRMLEAVSLAASPPESPGRYTEVVQPAGFEALLGVAIAPPPPRAAAPAGVPPRTSAVPRAGVSSAKTTPVDRARAARLEAAAARLDDARLKEAAARDAEAAAAQTVDDAELRAKQARAALTDARALTRAAVAARERAEREHAREGARSPG